MFDFFLEQLHVNLPDSPEILFYGCVKKYSRQIL